MLTTTVPKDTMESIISEVKQRDKDKKNITFSWGGESKSGMAGCSIKLTGGSL